MNMSRSDRGPALVVKDLRVDFHTHDGVVRAVDGVSYEVARGETLAIVGESGSGKSVSSLALLGLLPSTAKISGEVLLNGTSILGAKEDVMRRIRGASMAMIFQDALAALNPTHRVGRQIAEAVLIHNDGDKAAAAERAVELLDIVGVPQPRRRAEQYPHEFSGGMRQRAMIAMSIANEPDVLIADEPTTALDVTIQAQVMDVLGRIQERTGSAIVLITHDLGVVAGFADKLLVMYAGRQVEGGTVDEVFYSASHPYTQGLLRSLPQNGVRDQMARLYRIQGQPPSLIHLPPGCAFNPRCPLAEPGICDTSRPELVEVSSGHTTACLRSEAAIESWGASHAR
jgi:oligopeptide/dipeptide ABC transporter ATP-binding protein